MNDPFIYGLLLFLLILLLTLKSAISSINQLQLELDKSRINYHSRALNFISKRTTEFSVAIHMCYFLTLIVLIFYLRDDLIYTLQLINISLLHVLYVLLAGILIYPGLTILPKTIGEYFSNEIINFSAIPLVIIFILLFPIVKLIILLSDTPIKLFYHSTIQEDQKQDFNRDDLNKLVNDSQKHLDENEEVDQDVKLFKNALEFSEVKIRECMVPRNEITALELNDIEKDIKAKFIETGYSKILVYRETIENIIGYIKSKSLFSNSEYKSNIRNIKYFPESMPANKLLRYFIRAGQNIAVVVDEFGGTSGIVTIEDILEEIFGEIEDEHDTDDLTEKKLSEKDYIFSGRLEIDHINEKYHLNIPVNEDYETIAGFILYNTERLPKVNDQIEISPFKFKILKVSDTRLELLKLELALDQV